MNDRHAGDKGAVSPDSPDSDGLNIRDFPYIPKARGPVGASKGCLAHDFHWGAGARGMTIEIGVDGKET